MHPVHAHIHDFLSSFLNRAMPETPLFPLKGSQKLSYNANVMEMRGRKGEASENEKELAPRFGDSSRSRGDRELFDPVRAKFR